MSVGSGTFLHEREPELVVRAAAHEALEALLLLLALCACSGLAAVGSLVLAAERGRDGVGLSAFLAFPVVLGALVAWVERRRITTGEHRGICLTVRVVCTVVLLASIAGWVIVSRNTEGFGLVAPLAIPPMGSLLAVLATMLVIVRWRQPRTV